MDHIDARCARLAKTTLNLLNLMTHSIKRFQRGHDMHDYYMPCKGGDGHSAQLMCTKRAGGTAPRAPRQGGLKHSCHLRAPRTTREPPVLRTGFNVVHRKFDRAVGRRVKPAGMSGFNVRCELIKQILHVQRLADSKAARSVVNS